MSSIQLASLYNSKIKANPSLAAKVEKLGRPDEVLQLCDALYRGNLNASKVTDLFVSVESIAPHLRKCYANLYRTMQTAELLIGELLEPPADGMNNAKEWQDIVNQLFNSQDEDLSEEALAGLAGMVYSQYVASAIEDNSKKADVVAMFAPPGEGSTFGDGLDAKQLAILSNSWNADIIDWFGRFDLDLNRVTRRKKQESISEIDDVSLGSSLPDLFDDQFALLLDADLELQFFNDYLQDQLLQFELAEEIPQKNGPVVFMLDYSGSMGPIKGLAAGFVLAAAKRMIEQDRSFMVGLYSDGLEGFFDSSTSSNKLIDLMALLTRGLGGGTNFVRSFDTMLGRVGDAFEEADLVVVSDGQDALDEPSVKMKEARGRYEFGSSLLLIGNEAMRSKKRPLMFDSVLDIQRPVGDMSGLVKPMIQIAERLL